MPVLGAGCRCWCCELAVHLLVRVVETAGAGAGPVSWQCVWWRLGASAASWLCAAWCRQGPGCWVLGWVAAPVLGAGARSEVTRTAASDSEGRLQQ